MLFHFIKRDFADNRIYWALSLVGTVIVLPFIFIRPETVLFLGYLYFFLCMAPTQNMTGVNFRSQQNISRSYVLSLPVSRSKLFMMIQKRALIYFLPMIILALITPILYHTPKFSWNFSTYFPFELTFIVGCVWLLNSLFSLQMNIEQVIKSPVKLKRFSGWLQTLVIWFVEGACVGACLIVPLNDPRYYFATLPISIGFAYFRFKRSRQKWAGI